MEVSMSRYLIALLLLLVTLSALASAQVAPQRVRVVDTIMSAQIVTKVAPAYPPLARQARIQGAVVLKVQISKSGDVQNLQLVSGHPMLAPSAIEAVKQWKYKPFLLNGEAVEVETNVSVNFTLSDKPAAENEGVAGDVPGGIPGGVPGGVSFGVVGTVKPATPGDATHPPQPQRVRVSSGVAQGLLVTKVPPQYPPDARDQQIQGLVVMKVNIDKEGNVYKVELISGHPLLAPAAIEAVKQWKYKPYQLDGTAVEVETQVTVNFTLVE
jgi:TonB family protein